MVEPSHFLLSSGDAIQASPRGEQTLTHSWVELRLGEAQCATAQSHSVELTFYNAFLGASSLLKTQDAYLVGSGVLVIVLLLLPLLPGLVQYWQQPQKRRDFCNYRSLQIGSVSPEDLESLRSQTINDKHWKALWNGCQVGLDSEVVSLDSQQTIEGIAIARLETETSATVQSLYVNPKYRRCYYGTQLLNVLLQRLQQRGVKSVEVRVSQTHPGVERFWMNQGWQATEQTFSSVIPQPHRDHNQIQATTNPLLKCHSFPGFKIQGLRVTLQVRQFLQVGEPAQRTGLTAFRGQSKLKKSKR